MEQSHWSVISQEGWQGVSGWGFSPNPMPGCHGLMQPPVLFCSCKSLPKGQSSALLQLWMVVLFHNYIDKVSAIVESKMPLASTSSFHIILQEKHFLFFLLMWHWLNYILKGKNVCRYCWWLRCFIRQAVVLRAACACSVDTLSAVKHY